MIGWAGSCRGFRPFLTVLGYFAGIFSVLPEPGRTIDITRFKLDRERRTRLEQLASSKEPAPVMVLRSAANPKHPAQAIPEDSISPHLKRLLRTFAATQAALCQHSGRDGANFRDLVRTRYDEWADHSRGSPHHRSPTSCPNGVHRT